MAIELTDDGTLDTVLRCTECGEEMRYNYDGTGDDESCAPTCASRVPFGECTCGRAERCYDSFVLDCIEDAEAKHVCEVDNEPSEPEDGDLTTTDHETFYANGQQVLTKGEDDNDWRYYVPNPGGLRGSGKWRVLGNFDTCEAALRAYMDRVQFWPSCWWISDHGNAHLIDLTEAK